MITLNHRVEFVCRQNPDYKYRPVYRRDGVVRRRRKKETADEEVEEEEVSLQQYCPHLY